jgi:SAM-dependent methyltransferase
VTVTVLDPPIEAIDTSNYLKHTNTNPIQRRLIDRFHRVLLRKIAELSPTSFLDAGCGEGFVADLLLRQLPGLQLTGFDFNPEAVAVAQTKVQNATFQTASIFEIPFPDRSFDVVGCFEVLEHLPDPAAALRELARVSSRAVVLSVPHEPYFCLANVARGKNLKVRPRGSDPDHRNFWTRRAFGDFVNQALDVQWLGGSFPWTICVAKKRG